MRITTAVCTFAGVVIILSPASVSGPRMTVAASDVAKSRDVCGLATAREA